MNSKNELYNPIQYFFEHKRAPPVLHEILYYPNTYGTTLKDRLDELPENWRNFSTAVSILFFNDFFIITKNKNTIHKIHLLTRNMHEMKSINNLR